MLNMHKKLMTVLTSMIVVLNLTACSNDDASSIVKKTSTVTTTVTTTVKNAETSATTTTAKKKETKKSSSGLNLLTGLNDLSANAKGKRPVAIMVNNIDASMPQYGISKADVMFEFPVEGGITRLMALYSDYTKVPDVCSVRSARYYFAYFAQSFDAVYLHWGIDKKIAQDKLDELKIDHIDGNSG